MIDLDKIEAVARAAKEDHDLSGFRLWGTWFEEMNIGIAEQRLAEECSPDVVLALVARIRELQAGLLEACEMGRSEMSASYRRFCELEELAK